MKSTIPICSELLEEGFPVGMPWLVRSNLLCSDETINSEMVDSMVPKISLNIGDQVAFVGKESDTQWAEIDEFTAGMKVSIDDAEYGFEDVFKIKPLRHMYIGNLAKPGDSGAWILTGKGKATYGLAGILIAGSRDQYALCGYAENAFNRLSTESGSTFNPY